MKEIATILKISKFLLIFTIITSWLMIGWLQIWDNPRIPPEVKITNAATTTKFYLHDAASPDTGTLPGATTMSATTPNVTATGAGTNRDMDVAIGAAQTSAALTTLGQTALQKNWFGRFLSKPLAAQTLPTGIWTVQGGASESAVASNLLLWGAVIKVWRPSTGAVVATLLDNPTLGATEPGTTETNISQATASITGVAINDGDILVVELWGQNTQGNTTARTNTIFYDGTTEASITSNAAFLLAPGAITMQAPTFNQSAYRLFNNTDSIGVGTPLAAQDTAATLGSTGAAFRLRMLLHIDLNKLALSDQAFKLQFAQQSGTCDTGFVGETYADVTAATVIAYNDNPTPLDNTALVGDANDPTHGADTIVRQTYEELNNFTNSVAAIPSAQDGKWDFSLKDNGATASTAYCLRAVKSDDTVLNTYTAIPQITTAAAASLTFTVDTGSVSFVSAVTPGTPVSTSSVLTVNTNNATGYKIQINRASTTPTLILSSDNSTTISDTPNGNNWTAPAATSTAGPSAIWTAGTTNGLGFRVKQTGTVSNTYSSVWWGTDDTAPNAKYSGISTSTALQVIANTTLGSATNENSVVEYKLDTQSTQKSGKYISSPVVYTATANP